MKNIPITASKIAGFRTMSKGLTSLKSLMNKYTPSAKMETPTN